METIFFEIKRCLRVYAAATRASEDLGRGRRMYSIEWYGVFLDEFGNILPHVKILRFYDTEVRKNYFSPGVLSYSEKEKVLQEHQARFKERSFKVWTDQKNGRKICRPVNAREIEAHEKAAALAKKPARAQLELFA